MQGATREPLLESGPELAPVRKFARRQSTTARTIAVSLGEALITRIPTAADRGARHGLLPCLNR
jgi:hypothetical protein